MKFVYILRGGEAYGEKRKDRGYILCRMQYGCIGEYLFIGLEYVCIA